MMKLILGSVVAVLVALAAGFIWGASGRLVTASALELAELRETLLTSRSAVLDARLDIYSVNFGDASRHLEAAQSALSAADTRLTALGRQEEAAPLKVASMRIGEAQSMAGKLNQDANSLAADAARMINDVLTGLAAR